MVVAVAAALTLVPALLSLSGTATDHDLARQPADRGRRRAGLRRVHGRYVGLLLSATGWLVLLARGDPASSWWAFRRPCIFASACRTAGSQPTDQTVRRAYDLISEGFGPGANGSLVVVVYTPGGNPSQTEALNSYYQKVKAHPLPDVASIGQPIANPNHDLVVVSTSSQRRVRTAPRPGS